MGNGGIIKICFFYISRERLARLSRAYNSDITAIIITYDLERMDCEVLK